MREKNWKKNLLTCFGAAVLFVAAALGFPAVSVHAESGSVYSCTINRCYSHPVTGEIEDSGGEASYATGQGMVEGAVYASGLMEVTDSGNYYLTIRMSLIDYTSGHSFSVQNVGDSGWSGTGVAVTANGSDSNGTTSDICIQVPSENCIVRVSMYVTPMGRDVTFYLYPSDYSEGNSVGMNPAFVTEEASTEDSGSGEEVANSTLDTGSAQEAGTSEAADTQETDGTESTDETAQNNEGVTQSDAAATQAAAAQSTSESGSTESSSTGNADAMNSGNTVATAQKQAAAAKSSDESDTDKELNSAQGLNLSTAEEDSTTSKEKKSDGESSVKINTVFAIALAVTGSGLVLILVTALIIWYFRKNWRRWGGEDDDDDEY